MTEINGRAAASWHNLYDTTYGVNFYKAMTDVTVGKRVGTFPFHRRNCGKVGLQFPVITTREGRSRDLFDFEYARTISDIRIFVTEDTKIIQTHNSGIPLARFDLFGTDYQALQKKGNRIRNLLLK